MNAQRIASRFARFASIAVGVLTVATGCTVDDDADLTIENRSTAPINEIFFAEADDEDIGSNHLPAPLMPGDAFVINDVECEEYDVVLITQDVVCELRSLDICIDDRRLVIDDEDLAECLALGGTPSEEPAPEPGPPQGDPDEPEPEPEPNPPPPPDPY